MTIKTKTGARPNAGQKALLVIMKEQDLSRADVASTVEATEAAVWYWCAAHRIPSAIFISRLENKYGIKGHLWGQLL